MKTLGLITAAFILLFGVVSSRGANLDKISAETGVPVATLQGERASTGLGWGGIEKAHLLANASGQSFDSIVAQHQSGQGWGKIAHNNGLNLGTLVSNAHRSSNSVHGKSGNHPGRGHSSRMTTTRGISRGSSFRSAHTSFHSMRGTGGMSHGMGGMGHGGRGR